MKLKTKFLSILVLALCMISFGSSTTSAAQNEVTANSKLPLLSLSVPVSADESSNKVMKSYMERTPGQNDVLVQKVDFFDNEGKQYKQSVSKSVVATPDSVSKSLTRWSPYWIAKTDWWLASGFERHAYSSGNSTSYTESDEQNYYPIDKISVSTKIYYEDNVQGIATDTQTNASNAGAIAKSENTFLGIFGDFYGISTHAFELNGFKDWYPTTRKD
ncbi:hypothetical protein [Paenibacillus alvei]|uniref:Uncharacterized protein n=1 Tax=Paenibacillus alvei TaxID=44250 RepID=A0AAP6ZYF2_PAEAL|nr:hypothetical protein [Paenibacillus alvei]NOJ72319.1 hypothetical protein [Paenibacillus alvei]